MATLPAYVDTWYSGRGDLPARQHDPEYTFPLIRTVLGVALLGAPWAFGAVETWCWALLAFVIGLMLILWSMSCARRGVVAVVWSPFHIPLVLFALIGLFQLTTNSTADRISTRNALVELAAAGGLLFLVSQQAATLKADAWQGLGLIVLAYTFGTALFAIVQYLSNPKQLYWLVTPRSESWIFGPFVNHNHYAGLMEMLIPVCAGHVLSQRNHRLRPLLGFAVLVPISSVLLSGSRGGLLALLCETILLIAILLLKAPKDLQGRKLAGVALAIVVAVVGFAWMQPGGLIERFETVLKSSHVADLSFTARQQVALDSLRMWRHHLWFGVGLGAFEYAYPQYQSIPSDAVWSHAHDDYVEALGETGLLGGILVVATMIVGAHLAFRGLGERLKHRAGWIQLGAALGCCGLLLHSLVDFNLHIPANTLWFATCAALATSDPTLARTD